MITVRELMYDMTCGNIVARNHNGITVASIVPQFDRPAYMIPKQCLHIDVWNHCDRIARREHEDWKQRRLGREQWYRWIEHNEQRTV